MLMSEYDDFMDGAPLGFDDGNVRGAMDEVAYIDEYPHLEEKLRLQRLARPAVRAALNEMQKIVIFELPKPPDGAA